TPAQREDTHLDKERTPIQPDEIQPSDIVILLMGTTGSGMSHFINTATGMREENDAWDLYSCTQNIAAYPHSSNDGRRFIFVDTPGFNGTNYSSQKVVLEELARWMGR
ncbi:hypothetical protein ID866_6539, partial [Astraeus odoratus]